MILNNFHFSLYFHFSARKGKSTKTYNCSAWPRVVNWPKPQECYIRPERFATASQRKRWLKAPNWTGRTQPANYARRSESLWTSSKLVGEKAELSSFGATRWGWKFMRATKWVAFCKKWHLGALNCWFLMTF